MPDVTISYKGNSIATMSASGTKTLLTEGKYCEDDITIDYTAPGGGGVQTAYVTDVAAADTLYYTDANMTFQSGGFIDNTYLPLGTIVFVHDDGPTLPISPTGLTQRAQFTSGMHKYTVYEVTG